MEGVLRPGHFYVRTADAGHRQNIELLHRGEGMPDEWYRTRFPAPAEIDATFGRALSTAEVVGVIEYNAGNERRRQGRLAQAREAYARATKHFPGFAEAHASLGAVLQLLDSLDEAEQSYRAAWRANPNLPGLEWNMRLLDQERNQHDAGSLR
jgi:tetratricopeptide (TPR) repeat protein